jgi:hypothetical protein
LNTRIPTYPSETNELVTCFIGSISSRRERRGAVSPATFMALTLTRTPKTVPAAIGNKLAFELLGSIAEGFKVSRKAHTEEQIIAALKQHESEAKTMEICRKLGISQATF